MSASKRPVFVVSLLACAFVLAPAAQHAQTAPPAADIPAARLARQAAPPAARVAARGQVPALAILADAELAASEPLLGMRQWNDRGLRPTRNGFARALDPLRIELAALAASTPDPSLAERVRLESDGDTLRVGAWIAVEGATRLRLRLSQVDVPADVQFWVYGDGSEEHSFGLELRDDDGDLWTPSIGGERIHLELAVPRGRISPHHRLTIHQVMQSFEGADLYTKEGECLADASCTTSSEFPVIDLARRATGQLRFVVGSSSAVCSGTLINDKDESGFIPYLLTANHCFGTQGAASSLEVVWNYQTTSCNGGAPNVGSLPRSNGSTLLATGATSDFTLIRLNSIPGNRAFMGWNANANAVSHGTKVHRVSHPVTDGTIRPQIYTRSFINNTVAAASNYPRTNFHYEVWAKSSTFGGSSGSALLLDNGQIVGQLTAGLAGCSAGGYDWDGRFNVSFPALDPFLNRVAGDTSPCVPSDTRICLVGNRFEVTATFRTINGSGNLRWERHSDNTGLGFFSNVANKEVLLKVLNGCSLNNRFWIFAGGVTDQEISPRVRDTSNGAVWSYSNALGQAFRTANDTSAFVCP